MARRDGGTGGHVLDQAALLRGAGHEVRLVAGGGDVQDASMPSLTDAECSERDIETLQAAARELRPTIVHMHGVQHVRLAEAMRPWAPVVASAHNYVGCTAGTYSFEPGSGCTRAHGPGCVPHLALKRCWHGRDPRPLVGYYRRSSGLLDVLRTADGAIVYSHAMEAHLRRNAVGRRFVVPLFCDAQEHVDPPAGRRIAFVGRIQPEKGLDFLLRALVGLDAALDVYGDGWWRQQAARRAAALGIADRVVFHGWVSSAALSAAYGAARVVCVPSVWPEPFGLVGIEAMAHGRPAVASATGGIPDWLADDETGLLVAPGDADALAAALGRVLDDDALALRLGHAARERQRSTFAPAEHLRSIVAIYDTISSEAGHTQSAR